MSYRRLVVCTLLTLLVVATAEAADDDHPPKPLRPFNVTFAAGSHLHDGGDVRAVSAGYTWWSGLAVTVNLERGHVPTRVERYSNGSSVTRGGTATTISGEVRYTPWYTKRVSPFGFAGVGVGISRPNVNDLFPRAVTNRANVMYAGGGVVVMLGGGLGLTVDARFKLMAENGDALSANVPIRGGVTWRF